MAQPRTLFVLLCCALASVCAGCADEALSDPYFDLWCGGDLCKWEADEGQIARVGTWNRNDYGVSFVTTPAQISQLRDQAPPDCMLIETVADVAASARVMV